MIFITISTGHFDPLIRVCDELRDKYEFLGQIGCGRFVPKFPYFRMGKPSEIDLHMKKAELVITHAGTGMLSSLYRLKKPAIVIPKQIRYGEPNDSQVELGKKWCDLGISIFCMEIKELPAALEKWRKFNFSFPTFPSLGTTLKKHLELKEEKYSEVGT